MKGLEKDMTIDLSKKTLTQIELDNLNAILMGMSYGHYKSYQRTLAEKRKKRAKRERAKEWTKEKK